MYKDKLFLKTKFFYSKIKNFHTFSVIVKTHSWKPAASTGGGRRRRRGGGSRRGQGAGGQRVGGKVATLRGRQAQEHLARVEAHRRRRR
jgi:hypothetical protein